MGSNRATANAVNALSPTHRPLAVTGAAAAEVTARRTQPARCRGLKALSGAALHNNPDQAVHRPAAALGLVTAPVGSGSTKRQRQLAAAAPAAAPSYNWHGPIWK